MGGAFGHGVRDAISETLRQFLAQLGRPATGERPGRDVYVALGRGEFRAGRRLDALQSAYRVGARVAWRRLSEAAIAAGLERETLALLAEAIFAYIDEISAESVEGYASAQAASAGERARERQAVVRLLIARRPARRRQPRPPPAGRCRGGSRRSPPTIAMPSASPRSSARTRSARESMISPARSSATSTPRGASSASPARSRGAAPRWARRSPGSCRAQLGPRLALRRARRRRGAAPRPAALRA